MSAIRTAFFFFTAFFCFALIGNSSFALASSKKSKKPDTGSTSIKAASFEGSAAWKKMDLRLRRAWANAEKAGDKNKKFDLMIKTTKVLSDEEKATLKNAGFLYHTFIGLIVTGRVKAGELPNVAELELIQSMELAVPLSIKK